MALFTPGGGTLKSTSLEAALWEAIFLLHTKEKDSTVNPSNETRVFYAMDQNLIVNGNCTFPAIESLNLADDSVNWIISNYLNANFSFSPGTNGTLRASNLPAAIVAIARRIQNLEAQSTKNAQNLNRVQVQYDSEAKTVNLDFQCELTPSVSSTGQPIFTAKTYLVD